MKRKSILAIIDYSSIKTGKFITPCNKVSTKINCLNQQFSEVESKVCLTVNELVNLVRKCSYVSMDIMSMQHYMLPLYSLIIL